MLDQDSEGRFRLAALQSPAGRRLLRACGRSPEDISSIVLVEAAVGDGSRSSSGGSGNGGRGGGARNRERTTAVAVRGYIKSDAVLRIASKLPNGFPLLAMFGLPFPPFVRDTVYDAVADNRYNLLGRRDVCRLGDDRFEDRFITS